jgi:cytochrome c556
MQLLRCSSGPARRRVVTVTLGATALLGVVLLRAETSGDFIPQLTVVELMDWIVMPQAQIVWDAVAYDVTADGETITGPKTEEDWEKLRWSAVALAESANNLVVPGRAVNHPGVAPVEGELSPEKIHELMVEQWPAWVAYAHSLHAAAMEAVTAIDAKNAEGVSNAGGTIDAACEACHLQFWYPNQQ